MGSKLLWLGLTIIMTTEVFHIIPAGSIVGAVIMIFGCVMLLLDK